MGRTVLVMARMISAPPAENAALKIDANRLPITMITNVASIWAVRDKWIRLES